MDYMECPREAAEILMKAEEIKANPALFKEAQAVLQNKAQSIKSIADLRKVASEKLSQKDLMTDEDKAAIQEMNGLNKKLREMGFKVETEIEIETETGEEEEEEDEKEEY